MGIFSFLKKHRKPATRPLVRVLPTAPAHINKVKPSNTSLYVKRGWVQIGNRYYGYYRTKYKAYQGEIIRRGDKYDAFIIDPPVKKLKRHPKWECVKKINKRKIKVHLRIQPKDRDVGAIVLYIETLIIESYRL